MTMEIPLNPQKEAFKRSDKISIQGSNRDFVYSFCCHPRGGGGLEVSSPNPGAWTIRVAVTLPFPEVDAGHDNIVIHIPLLMSVLMTSES